MRTKDASGMKDCLTEMTGKNSGYSNLRALSCLAIVILHTFYAAMAVAGITPEQKQMCMMVRNSMFWAVPCFVMVTGALLLDPSRDVTWEKIRKKYLRRILKALVGFSLLFFLFDTFTSGKSFSLGMVREWLVQMVTDTGWSHMWYLYLMIAIYLMLPFYRMIAAQASGKELRRLLVIYLVFQSVFPAVSKLWGTDLGFYLCVNTVYPLYLFGGYYLARKKSLPSGSEDRGRDLLAGALLTAAGLAAILVCTGLGFRQESGVFSKLVGNYSFPGAAAASAGMFLLVRSVFSGPNSFLEQIDRNSFGIYLIHMLFLKLLIVVLKFDPFRMGGGIGVLFFAALTAAVSWLCVEAVRRAGKFLKLT